MNPLFLSGYGLSINVDGRKLIVFSPSENKRLVFEPHRFPYDSLIVSGYYGKISFEALRWLDVHGISFSLINYRGENFTQTLPTETKFGELRVKQYSAYLDSKKRLEIGSTIIKEKIRLSKLFLETLKNFYPFEFEFPSERFDFKSISDVRLYEASCAEFYFKALSQVVKLVSKGKIQFNGRNTKFGNRSSNASDIVNALLNYGYAILESYSRKFIRACGLDLNVGFVHDLTYAKEPLVYDMQELFRWLVDYSLITLLEKGSVANRDFHTSSDYTLVLKPKIAKAFVNEIKTNFSIQVKYSRGLQTYDSVYLDCVRRLSRSILTNKALSFDIPMFHLENKANIALNQNILSMTPSQRKALGINKSTLWYQKRAVLRGKPFKLYSKTISRISG